MKRILKNKITALNNDHGFGALILVIWIVVMLIAIAGAFSYSMKTEINIMRNFREEEEAYRLALAGLEQAKMEILSIKDSEFVYLNQNDLLMLGDLREGEEDEPNRSAKLGRGKFSYTITDEEGKLNINLATKVQIRQILLESGVEVEALDTIVDSILDWRDTNDLHMLNGAEEDYYQSLDEPYSCKDGPFDAIEELLLVKGMTPEILYGSGNEEAEGSYSGIIGQLTVMGSGRININTAPVRVLEAVFGLETAENIISQREYGPITGAISKGKLISSVFTIVSTGANMDGSISRTVKTILELKNNTLEMHYWNDNFIG